MRSLKNPPPSGVGSINGLSSWSRFIPVALLLTATAFVLEARDRKEALPGHEELSSFPIQVKGWRGKDLTFDPGDLEVLGPGEFLLRNYVRSTSEPLVNLYIAFFPSQRAGDTIHSPKNCLPGSGWIPMESGHISVRRADGATISINRYIVANGDNRDLVLYWYQAHGRVTPSEYWAKIFLLADAIRMNRTDGALVRVITPLASSQDEAPAQTRALEFVHQILPILDSYIPR
jgi:EpsI family protein